MKVGFIPLQTISALIIVAIASLRMVSENGLNPEILIILPTRLFYRQEKSLIFILLLTKEEVGPF